MSYVHICLSRSKAVNSIGQPLPLAMSAVHASQVIASSGTSQQSSALSYATGYADPSYYVWTIKNGGDVTGASSLPVYIVFGSDPTAVANGTAMRHLLLVGDTFECVASTESEKVAVINADITT